MEKRDAGARAFQVWLEVDRGLGGNLAAYRAANGVEI
jgi:hypothetical protein